MGKIAKAFNEFGFKSLNLSEKGFTKKGINIQLGYEPLRVDILASIRGVSFNQVRENKTAGIYGNEQRSV